MSKNKMVIFYWVVIALLVLLVVRFVGGPHESDTANVLDTIISRGWTPAFIACIIGLFLERYGKKRDVPQCCDKKDDNNEVVNS